MRLTTSDVIGGTAVQVGSAPLSLHKNPVVCIPEHRDPTAVRDKEDSCLQTSDNFDSEHRSDDLTYRSGGASSFSHREETLSNHWHES